jgi:hypothetical protein
LKKLSINPNITIDFIKKYKNKPFDWYSISQHNNITISDITNNLQLPILSTPLNYNKNITIKYILNNKKSNVYNINVLSLTKFTYYPIIYKKHIKNIIKSTNMIMLGLADYIIKYV